MKKGIQTMKRVLSFVMAFAMVLTLLPAAVFAADSTMTIYFENNWNWPDAKIYWWGSTSGTNPDWNGVEMTYVDTTVDGYDRYMIEVPTDITGMLFNGTGGYGTDQSADITSGWYDGICYYMTYDSATDTKPAGSYEYAPVTALQSPSGSTNKVYFDNSAKGWATVNVYFWDNTKTYDLSCTWPGVEMTSEGDNVYSYDVPVEATHLIFNNSSDKTADLVNPGDGTFVYDGTSWSEYTEGGEDSTVTYYAVGNEEFFGAITQVDPEKPLTLTAEGKYEITYESVPAGEHYFFITDSTGEERYIADNVVFTLDAVSNVTITFDAEAKSATYTAVPVNTTDPSDPDEGEEETEAITVYFRNDWLWPEVRIHYWGSTTAAGTEWPGAVMQLVENETNIYFAEIPADVTGIVFNGEKNDNSGTIQKTVDITTDIQDGNGYVIIYDGSDETETDNYGTFTYTPGGGEGSDTAAAYYLVGYINNADYNGQDYQFVDCTLNVTFTNDSYVVVKDQTGDWYMTAAYCTETSGTFAKGNEEKMFVAAGSYTFTLVENDDGTLTMSYASAGGGEGGEEEEPGENVFYEATFHFINTLNWNVVNLYTWIGSGELTGGWPGSATPAVGGYNTATVTFEAAEGTDLNFIFNNGSTQTVDLTLPASAFTKNEDGIYTAEKYVALTTQDNGKYNAAIVDSPEAIVNSPIVDGSSVTFNYGDNSATTVSVAGSFNKWSATATPMEKNSEGVWTVTVKDLAAGSYEYKFVVNGDTWVLDPMNSNVVTEEDDNQNSAFYILSDETVEDDNKVTINIHYTRDDGNYENWNLWVWGSAMGGHQVDFETTDENGAVVATVVLENAREHQSISFKERLSVEGNEWAAEGDKDRRIDLSTIVSGTIDYYIPSGNCVYGEDVIRKNKISSVELDYDNGVINVTSVQAIPNPESALKLVKGEEEIDVTITAVGSKYSLALPKGMELNLSELYLYQVDYYGDLYAIAIDAAYASNRFAEEYTYEGNDLGATYTGTKTTFKVWAPTATAVSVKLYATGSDAEAGATDVGTYAMTKGDKGVWSVTIEDDLEKTYYTYAVTVDGKTVEAVDPYARTTGVNGKRGMIIDLDSTDPTGWEDDKNPNKVTSQTDAVIYELHVRDFSNNASSGVSTANRGKYLAFTETDSTAMQYLTDLGITHLHLLPVYDYGSVDETTCSNFNWGYDPVNYNVPEGSYSGNPYDGATRVSEFKQMVKSLHDNGISVVMDVVYNHVYNADKFCFNNIVPGYFSRVDSNTSGCGNDTASEREMVRKYIVESVLYWHQEYHIDGFRFDLVGLLDVDTINDIVKTVHACCPDVIFYGEGWQMDSTNKEPGTQMAKQGNANLTPGFAYFSDSMRNNLAGDNGKTTGFVSGAGNGTSMVTEWLANPWWTNNPQQVVQYVSCHDNYTLVDKLIISTKASGVTANIVKMNNLAAAFYMTAQGVPFIHAGEEFLREKLNDDGSRNHNSYNASDKVNNIDWSDPETYAENVAYYKGLIAFRKAHPALRYSTAALVKDNVQTYSASGNLIVMRVDGNGAGDDDIFVIFNAGTSAQSVNLPEGEWTININGDDAGTASLGTATGTVSVAGISAMVLTKEDEGKDEAAPVGPSEEKTVYFSNNKRWTSVYAYAWTGTTEHLGDWPGTAMTYVETNDYGEDIYCVTLPASENGIEGLVFHNNSDTQTVDIVPGIDGTGYYCTDPDAEGHYEVGTYTYRAPVIGGADEYYLHGWINNADYTGTDYKFGEDGTVTVTFPADSYVYVTNGDGSETYMTDGYQGAVKSAVLKDTSKHTLTADKWDKLLIPGGDEVVITMVKNSDNTVTLSYESSTSAFEDKSGVQKGVTLHCWNWSFDNITANMATIADMGYTAIQTSPIQPLKEATNGAENTVGSHWWVYYQPVDFVITTDSGNALGTKTDFKEMCAEAEKYGIKVIVDVVANHMANETGNNLSSKIPEKYTSNKDYWHDIKIDITDWKDRYDMTQHCMGGLPDLNTANDDIQNYVLKFLKECVDAGADGFRFDAAKSIETPKDDASFASDFWPTVVNGIQEYAGNNLYIYGEILDDQVIAISAYTQYMSVTDNGWGNHMRMQVAEDTANLVAGFYKSAPASNLVIWAESHDTYADASSSGVSEADINKTWALVAARADAMGLYFARPESINQALGVASATGWDNPEVEAVNEFHNAFVGQSESIGNENGVSYVERGTSGVVLVNVSAASNNVSVTANAMADGTYIDQITGNTFTVANGKISGTIGDTGIAVVRSGLETVLDVQSGKTYGSLAEALADTAAGNTLKLLRNHVEENMVIVNNGVKLDLNGKTLTTDYIAVFNGSDLVDSNSKKGLLAVPQDKIILPADNEQMPVWNGANGYVLTAINLSYERMNTEDTNYVFKSSFKPSFGKLNNDLYIAKKYFVDETAASDNGIQIILRLSWVNDSGNKVSQDFLYSDKLVQTVYADPESRTVFTLGVTRLASNADVTVNVVVISDTGVESVSAGKVYTG